MFAKYRVIYTDLVRCSGAHDNDTDDTYCLAGQTPVYLRELCVRSAEQGDLVMPRVRLATAERRSFAVVGPSFWNALPSRLRSELLALSLPLFRSRLKT